MIPPHVPMHKTSPEHVVAHTHFSINPHIATDMTLIATYLPLIDVALS